MHSIEFFCEMLDLQVALRFMLIAGRDKMGRLMTIQKFSTKTGISKSTLRFYESKKLLIPVRKEVSGYRLYTEKQVPIAKSIASLRLAGISIQEILLYLQANEIQQLEMRQNWIQAITAKRKQLETSLHYLESNQTEQEIYLFEKDAEQVIWFRAEAPPGQFGGLFIRRRAEIKQFDIVIKNTYLRYLSGNKQMVQAEIGFGVERLCHGEMFPDAILEKMVACLCIGLSFNNNYETIQTAYRRLFHHCVEHNWEPAGPIFEWYRGDQIDELDVVMPITQIGGRLNDQ